MSSRFFFVKVVDKRLTEEVGRCFLTEIKLGVISVEENSVGDSVEGCREFCEDEYTDVTRSRGDEEVVGDSDKGSLNVVVCSEARLKGFVDLMVGHVMVVLGSSCFLERLEISR